MFSILQTTYTYHFAGETMLDHLKPSFLPVRPTLFLSQSEAHSREVKASTGLTCSAGIGPNSALLRKESLRWAGTPEVMEVGRRAVHLSLDDGFGWFWAFRNFRSCY